MTDIKLSALVRDRSGRRARGCTTQKRFAGLDSSRLREFKSSVEIFLRRLMGRPERNTRAVHEERERGFGRSDRRPGREGVPALLPGRRVRVDRRLEVRTRALSETPILATFPIRASFHLGTSSRRYSIVVVTTTEHRFTEATRADVYREIRALRDDAKIIIASGYGSEDIMRSLSGEKPAGTLAKPYDHAALIAVLPSVLGEDKD